MTLRESVAAARLGGPLRPAGHPENVGDVHTAVWEFRFETDDPVFAGHFPGRPLLPGIFQLEMARRAKNKPYSS